MTSILEKIFKKRNELQYVYAEYHPMELKVNQPHDKKVVQKNLKNRDDDMHIDKIYQSS
jgi:hypothetical protein